MSLLFAALVVAGDWIAAAACIAVALASSTARERRKTAALFCYSFCIIDHTVEGANYLGPVGVLLFVPVFFATTLFVRFHAVIPSPKIISPNVALFHPIQYSKFSMISLVVVPLPNSTGLQGGFYVREAIGDLDQSSSPTPASEISAHAKPGVPCINCPLHRSPVDSDHMAISVVLPIENPSLRIDLEGSLFGIA